MPRGQKDAAFYDSAALLVLSLLEEADKTGFQLLHEVECRGRHTPFLPADPSGRENAHLLPGTVENLPQANRRWRLCHQIS